MLGTFDHYDTQMLLVEEDKGKKRSTMSLDPADLAGLDFSKYDDELDDDDDDDDDDNDPPEKPEVDARAPHQPATGCQPGQSLICSVPQESGARRPKFEEPHEVVNSR